MIGVRGGGVSANCCARLLQQAGARVVIERSERPSVPALLLSDPARTLMRDVLNWPDLFSDNWRIDRRVVAWGGGEPVTLPHSAVVLSQTDLDDALTCASSEPPFDERRFTIHAARPFPAGDLDHFGNRQASATQVSLNFEEDKSTCWIESAEEGWLFFIPCSEQTGWLLSVGAPVDTLLQQSRWIAPRVALAAPTSGLFETAPRLHFPLRGADWLACGGAAIAFDPICGDGSAQAVREGILASAVIVAIEQDEDPEPFLTHYEAMLIASMRRHLRNCAAFYESGGHSPWWLRQMEGLATGFELCSKRLSSMPEPQFILKGLQLVPRESAA